MKRLTTHAKLFATILLCLPFMASAQHSPLIGKWDGRLAITPEMSLRLVLNIDEDGTATMDSPDQGAMGIPLILTYLSDDSISVGQPQLSMLYCGKLKNGTIEGQFQQGKMALPLNFTKFVAAKRPQTPVPPFPYPTEEVTFASAQPDGAQLKGTFSTPGGFNADTPVAILLTGSGVHNRDEEIFEHKPFAVIADYLARNGIATLRYDDRGYDITDGPNPNETTRLNAMDAEGAINYLKSRGFKNIGLIGHSEGGLVADMLASEAANNVAFVVQIGGPAVGGDSILLYQNEVLLRDGGIPEDYITMYLDAMRGYFDSQRDSGSIPFDESKYAIFSEQYKSDPVLTPLVKNLRDSFTNLRPWLRFFINYDPLPDIKKINVPLLMLYGGKDTQVAPALNVPRLEKEVTSATVKVYPNLNHLMQHGTTGAVTEYSKIEETFAPEVLADIAEFIGKMYRH